jgi:hypothetical protein
MHTYLSREVQKLFSMYICILAVFAICSLWCVNSAILWFRLKRMVRLEGIGFKFTHKEWLPKNETHCRETIPKIRNEYSQNRKSAATVPISSFMCLWAIYIHYSPDRSAYSVAEKMWTDPGKYKLLTDTWM